MSKYNKGDKFIIELDEQVGDLWKIKGFNALVFDDFGLDRLGQLVQGVDKFSYNEGAENAWELAQRIVLEPDEGGFSARELKEIFGYSDCLAPFEKFSYTAAAEKVEAWEKEKSEIRVGDVCRRNGDGKFLVVTRFRDDGVGYMYCNGAVHEVSTEWFKNNFTKTGRHIDIEAVLAQIK